MGEIGQQKGAGSPEPAWVPGPTAPGGDELT